MEQPSGLDPDLNKDLLEDVIAPATAPAPTVGEKPPVAEVREARIDEVHNALNTPAKHYVPGKSIFSGHLETTERENGYLSVFLGNHKGTIGEADQLVAKWLTYRASLGMYEEGDITETELAAAKANWHEWLQTEHPGEEVEAMEKYCYELYEFMDNIQDGIKIRSRMLQEGQITNLFNRGSGFITGDITGKKPSTVFKKDMSLSERMRRSSLNANQDLYEFDVLLRNTFAAITVRRPNLLSLGSLITAIGNQVKGYVRQINNPSPTLAYIAGIRAFWDYTSKLITYSSVKDTNDFKELGDSILLTDMDELCVGLLNAVYTRGVPLELRCLTPKCGWSELGIADPSRLVQVRKHIETAEEAAIYANLQNHRVKLSREEMAKLQKNTQWKLEDDRIYSQDGLRYFRLASPTLNQAFETFDFFTSVINPRVQELRSNTLDPKEFDNQLSALLASISSAEYIHWISEYGQLPEPGSNDEPEVFLRPAHNTDEFNKGLMAILDDDPDFGNRMVKYVYNKTPFMSRIFTGVDHHECPSCKKNSEENDALQLGYTPINAFMSFFTLTQLKLMLQTVNSANNTREAHSD